MPFLSSLKREEVAEQMTKNGINIGKTGDKFIERGLSCDRSRMLANTKFKQKRETVEQADIPCPSRESSFVSSLLKKGWFEGLDFISVLQLKD